MSASFVTGPAWIDFNTADVSAASAFYGDLLGWELGESHPDAGGWLPAFVGGESVAGISPRPGPVSHWSVFFGSTDIAADYAHAVELGATPMMAPFEVVIGGKLMTTIAGVLDPTGAGVGLVQPAMGPGLQYTHGHGAPIWYELLTRDLDAATTFYTELLGSTSKHSPDSPSYDYRTLSNASGDFAGLMQMPEHVPADMSSYWSIYFAVDDIDAAVAAATSAGATLLMGPMTIPPGRISSLLDPEGAPFNLMTPAS